MADVQVNQSPGGTSTQPVETGGGGSGAAWAIVVIVLLAIVAWFVFGRGMIGNRNTNVKADVKVQAPSTTPAPSGTKSP